MAISRSVTNYFNPRQPRGVLHLIVLGILALLALWIGFSLFGSSKTSSNVASISTPPVVQTQPISDLSTVATFDTVGTVEAVSQANLQVEASGRVTNVNVQIGDRVGAGTVLATIENKAQKAALTQAQGSYDAALAGAAQSDVGASKAQTSVVATLDGATAANRSAFNTVNSVFINSLDQFYSSPTEGLIGMRLTGTSKTQELNDERYAFRTILQNWRKTSAQQLTAEDISTSLDKATAYINRALDLVNTFIAITTSAKQSDSLDGKPVNDYAAGLIKDQATLNGILASLSSAQTTYETAVKGKRQAQLAGTNEETSSAKAQVTIARGALQAARANYEKTFIRTPIRGVVNALYLKSGDYASIGQKAAIVANNNGLQVKTYVNQTDSMQLQINDAVAIEGGATGVITAKAGAVDPNTGKVAVVVSVDDENDLVNGSTVHVTFTAHSQTDTKTTSYTIPLTSLRMGVDNASVFTVNADNKLVAHAVDLGKVLGDSVEITDGISKDMQIITDARGLKEGTKVTIENQ